MITVQVTQTISCSTQAEYDQAKAKIQSLQNLQQTPSFNDLVKQITLSLTQQVDRL